MLIWPTWFVQEDARETVRRIKQDGMSHGLNNSALGAFYLTPNHFYQVRISFLRFL